MWTPIFGLMPLLLAFQSAITPVTAGFIQGVDGVWLRHGKGGDVGRLDPRDNDVFTFKVVIGKYEGNVSPLFSATTVIPSTYTRDNLTIAVPDRQRALLGRRAQDWLGLRQEKVCSWRMRLQQGTHEDRFCLKVDMLYGIGSGSGIL